VSGRRGFTLVDMLVALTIMGIVLTAVYAVFAFQSKAVRAAGEGRDASGQGLLILDRLTRDLAGAWLPLDRKPNPRIVYEFKASEERLDFASTGVLSMDESVGPEIVEVGYRLEPGREGRQQQILIRRQDDTPDEEPDEGGFEIILTQDLVSLEILYLDGEGEEKTEWSSGDDQELPAAVRIKLVLSTIENQEEVFMTWITPTLSWPRVPSISLPFNIPGLL
jgi:general secretion pathway protein J